MIQRQLESLVIYKELNEDADNYLEIDNYIGYNNMIKLMKTEYYDKVVFIAHDNNHIVKNTRSKINECNKNNIIQNNI
jgi:hypothetical protein